MRAYVVAPMLAALLGAVPAVTQTSPAVPVPAPANTLPSVAVPPEVERVLRDYEKAWAANDAQALAALFTEDGIALPSNRPPARGRADIAKAYAGGGGMPTYLRVMDYRSAGELAYLVGGYGPAGQDTDFGKFVLVLRKVDGRWLIQSDIENANMRLGPPARPAARPAG